jgi:UDP-N-acetylmuramate: L-alanyl-gamma-D-glutamyl-meso-diaminopimelate ligase
MHIHILGICGTFMGGIAVLARAAGHTVTGCDANVYPPMSTQLVSQGIQLIEGYDAGQADLNPDLFVIGNVVSRGNPLMEAILDKGLPYVSGPQWLADNILCHCRVLAVAGTHGKTTTASLAAWILEFAGKAPGFLVGGVPGNFGVSARLPEAFGLPELEKPWFVIEADEYDTAFFDKRSKFVHYHPQVAILNNLEYDHADIFPDVEAIITQFHHLLRTIPSSGLLVVNAKSEHLRTAISRGCWTPVVFFGEGADWQVSAGEGAAELQIKHCGKFAGSGHWAMLGEHNRQNALAVLLAAEYAGVPMEQGLESLKGFEGVKRRMELLGTVKGVAVFDDFAHHPTAIETTVAGLRAKVGPARILAVIEPRSNTMKLGVWTDALADSLKGADRVFCYAADIGWDVEGALKPLGLRATVETDMEKLVSAIAREAQAGDQILVMSNGGFGGIHQKILKALQG